MHVRDTLRHLGGPATSSPGAACVRCAEPLGSTAGRALCATCQARLRVLLSARAGVRPAVYRSPFWPVSIAALLTLSLVAAALVRQLASPAPDAPTPQAGVWQVLGDTGFNSPVGLAADRLGHLYVVDAAACHIYKLAADGKLLATFGQRGTAPGEFDRPTAVAVDPVGILYVADTANNRIQIISPTGGGPLRTLGSFGTGPGQLNGPRGLAVDGEFNVYVADTGNDRVQKFSPLGQVDAIWGRTGTDAGEFRQPFSVALDASGSVYVADTGNHRIQKLAPNGVPIAAWGTYGAGAGQFSYPRWLDLDARGHIFVSDSYNHRIQELSSAGLPLRPGISRRRHGRGCCEHSGARETKGPGSPVRGRHPET